MPTTLPTSDDAVVETTAFGIKYKNEIAAVFIVALLAMIGWAGYWFYSERQNSGAAGLLASAKSVQDYEQIIAHYPNTPASASAYLLLAEAQRHDKKFSEANETLRTFISKYPQHDLVSTARMAMATNLEAMGKAEEALSMYAQVAATFPKNYIAPFALLAQAELLKAKGRTDEARRVCEAIMTQYRENIVAAEASRQLRSLKSSGSLQQPGGKSAVVPATGANNPPPLLARPALPAPANAAPIPSAAPKPK
jgi:TolA-binding protein